MKIFYREAGEIWESVVGSLIRKVFIQHTRNTLKRILPIITAAALIISSTFVLMLGTHKMPTRNITTTLKDGIIPNFLLYEVMARQIHHFVSRKIVTINCWSMFSTGTTTAHRALSIRVTFANKVPVILAIMFNTNSTLGPNFMPIKAIALPCLLFHILMEEIISVRIVSFPHVQFPKFITAPILKLALKPGCHFEHPGGAVLEVSSEFWKSYAIHVANNWLYQLNYASR